MNFLRVDPNEWNMLTPTIEEETACLKIYINTYNVAVIVKEMAKLCRKFTWKERMIYEISVNKG